uniref:Uncharacterized protein n=1 Tax=Oryza glaberrima TaxID=4538 RepID=I1R6Y5_ORYGL
WKAEHMKVRNDIKDFVITEVPNDTTSKEGMQADFRNFFEIIFPYYEHEEIDSASGEKKKVLPCYFLQFQHNCMEVPEVHEREKLEKFQRLLGCHPAFMSPAALSTLICHLYRDCDSLRKPQDTVYEPLQVSETLLIEWRGVRHFGIPFSNVYWHFFVDVYELGYWFLLKYLRNFIEHAHRYTKDQGTVLDIVTTALMIGEYLSKFVPQLILFIVRNCDIDGPFSTTWTMFEDSEFRFFMLSDGNVLCQCS